MKQADKESFENNTDHDDTKKTIVKAYLSNRECPVQKAVSYISANLSGCVFC